jgi:hypothetical protein
MAKATKFIRESAARPRLALVANVAFACSFGLALGALVGFGI